MFISKYNDLKFQCFQCRASCIDALRNCGAFSVFTSSYSEFRKQVMRTLVILFCMYPVHLTFFIFCFERERSVCDISFFSKTKYTQKNNKYFKNTHTHTHNTINQAKRRKTRVIIIKLARRVRSLSLVSCTFIQGYNHDELTAFLKRGSRRRRERKEEDSRELF